MKIERRQEKGSKIRKNGLIPGVIYGKGMESTPIQAEYEAFRKIYAAKGNSKTFDVEYEGKSHIVYIKETKYEHMNFHKKTHFDLVKVAADDTMTTKVYVKFLNKDDVKKRGLVIQSVFDDVEIEFPVGSGISNLELDVKGLEDKDSVTVGQIPVPEGIKILTDPNEVIVVISTPKEYDLGEDTDTEEVLEVESIKQSNE